MKEHKTGDLVHIPQAVTLIDRDSKGEDNAQLTIPLRIEETKYPTIGIVASAPSETGYVRVFCKGSFWDVKQDNVYTVET